MSRVRLDKVVKGYVVRRETIVDVPDPKHQGQMLKRKHRVDVSRVFHARSAADTYLEMCKKQWPDGDFYIHEKSGGDGLTHAST